MRGGRRDFEVPGVRSASIGGRGGSSAGYFVRQSAPVILVLAVSGALLLLVWIYGAALRDPRYLDGWILAGGMALQIAFHVARKTASMSPKSAMRWRKFHIVLGYVLIAAFISHSDFSLPDTAFEWALSASFVLVALSGIFGAYLAWSLKAKRSIGDVASYDRIPDRRAELAQLVHALVTTGDPSIGATGLPVPPQGAWIKDLYANGLQDFFERPGDIGPHLIGSQRPLKQQLDEIESLARFVDKEGAAKLAAIKELVIEKDQLDFARVHLALTRAWLFIHVPVTYALIVLTVLHVLVVYAFSSGVW